MITYPLLLPAKPSKFGNKLDFSGLSDNSNIRYLEQFFVSLQASEFEIADVNCTSYPWNNSELQSLTKVLGTPCDQ